MKLMLVVALVLKLSSLVSCLKVVVSGYNSKLAVYDVLENTLIPFTEWDVGNAGKLMTWLQIEDDKIYASHEVDQYEGEPGSVVSRWQISPDGAEIEMLEFSKTGSSGTAHLLVDKEYDKVYASNYGGASISVINLKNDGSLGELEINHEYNDICQKSNPHQVLTKGNWVFVVDLGCDKIWHYIHEANGQDWLRKETDVKTGAGPRHGVFHQTKDLMFLLCEQQSLVQVYRFSNEGLELASEVELSSTATDYGAEILVGPTGEFVYASSRGTGVVVVYKLEQDDSLTRIQEFKLNGTWPRSMAIMDTRLVVTDQKGGTLQLLAINPETGLIGENPGNVYKTPPEPAFVGFMTHEIENETRAVTTEVDAIELKNEADATEATTNDGVETVATSNTRAFTSHVLQEMILSIAISILSM